jgi:ferredoxin-NADP reductase
MKRYTVDTINSNSGYSTLRIVPQSDHDAMRFWPGQYATLAIQTDGHWSPTRCLSLTNVSNGEGVLEFGFRVTGNFTRALAESRPGFEVRVQGPYGDFVLPDHTPVVMIAGGIGITPFMSMLRTTAVTNSQQQLTLLFSARSSNDIPYEAEIRELTSRNPNIRAYFFVGNSDADPQRYIAGKISQDHLSKVAAGIDDQLYYICGPEPMMQAMTKTLLSIGVDHDDILTESFSAGSKSRTRFFGLSPVQVSYALGAMSFVVIAGIIGFKDVRHKVALAQAAAVPAASAQSNASNTPAPQTPAATNAPNSTQTPATNIDTDQNPDTSLNPSTDTNSTDNSTPTRSSPTPVTPAPSPPSYTNTYQPPRSQMS